VIDPLLAQHQGRISRTGSGTSRRRLCMPAASPVMPLAICPGFMCRATALSHTVCAARIFVS
jgi:hypothetical protein